MGNGTEGNAYNEAEIARIKALDGYRIADTPPEASFNDLANLASQIYNLPICLITFIDRDQVFFKANVGLGTEQSEPRKGSLCDEAIKADGVTVYSDVHQVPHLVDNTYGVRFYAAAPLLTSDGYRIGTLCVMGKEPMLFDERKKEILTGLAKVVMDQVELRLIALDDELLKHNIEQLHSFNEEVVAQNSNLIEFQDQITQANNDLENIQDSFETLFERAPIAIGIFALPNKTFLQANAALLKILEKDNSIIGQSIENTIPDIEGQDFFEIIDRLKQIGDSYSATEQKLRVSNQNGLKNLFVNCSFQLLGRLGDETQNVMFILSDVTEQVVAKQLTEEANVVLMSAIEAGGMGYTIVEFATGKMTSNAQLKNNYGYLADEDFNYPDLFDAMLPKYRQQIKAAVQEAIASNGVYHAEYEVKWRDGSIHWIRAYGKPRYDIHGRASHIIGLNKIILK